MLGMIRPPERVAREAISAKPRRSGDLNAREFSEVQRADQIISEPAEMAL